MRLTDKAFRRPTSAFYRVASDLAQTLAQASCNLAIERAGGSAEGRMASYQK